MLLSLLYLKKCDLIAKFKKRKIQEVIKDYLYLQKLKCPKCGSILGSKATTKKNSKSYFYYYCNDCKIEFKEKLINDMDIKDKLRLAIYMDQSKWTRLKYNTTESYEKFDNMLKDIDEEYRTTLINFGKYKPVMFAMTKLVEMETTE